MKTPSEPGVIPPAMETHPGTALTPLSGAIADLYAPLPWEEQAPQLPTFERLPMRGPRHQVTLSFHPAAWDRLERLLETGLYGRTMTAMVEQLVLRSLRYAVGAR